MSSNLPKTLKAAAAILIIGAASIFMQSAAGAAERRDFHGRDFGRFSFEERRVWTGGRWIHDYHDGRLGWWWVVDGGWYFYPQPVYPYPGYVSEVVVEQTPPPYAYPSAPIAAPPAPVWYYCDNPQGYYPYVPNCNGPWRPVPATPPAPPP